ncbi:MAG: chromosome segregation protein SMC, partial [Clostridia bacterium]
MNFQKLELQGFKSFADKTVISFKEGITVIVGPNGCGKSNVADAIRWVLGEQRPSTMRGQSMTDVIFNGTEVRRSLSYAEVSLFFDNRSRIFPIDFDDVVLTRKIDRSGVGEYFINRGKCRLKDIVSLMHDTGIGREGYSIIGQGSVSQIINARPADRRAIFEEAAGIASFKSKKIETERKLERANESLSRVKDILHEIEIRLEPLAKQAKNAARYNELYTELKDNEINYFLYRYENNKEDVDAITTRLQKIILDTVAAEQEYQSNEDKYEDYKSKINKIDEEISVLNNELLQLKVSVEHTVGEGKVLATRAGAISDDIKRLEGENKNLTAEIEGKSAELCDRVNVKELKNSELQSVTAEMLKEQAELDAINTKLYNDETEIEHTNRRIVMTAEELGNIKSNLSKYVAERDLNVKRLESLKNVVRDKKQLLDKEYTSKSILESNVVKLKNDRIKMDIHHNEKAEELKDKRESLQVFNEDKGKLNSRISALEERYHLNIQIKENYEYYSRAIKLLMNDFKVNPELAKRSQGVIAELIKTPEGMESAFDTAFGNGLQNIITNDEEDAKYIIDFLKRKGYGQITFQPMSVIRGRRPDSSQMSVTREHGVLGFAADLLTYDEKFDNVIRGMLGNTIIVTNIDTAIRISKTYRYTFKIVTLDGDIIAQHGAITGGSRKPDTANILAKDREIAKIKNDMEKSRGDLDKLSRMCCEADSDIKTLEREIKDDELSLSSTTAQLLVNEEKLNKSTEIIEGLELDVKLQADEIDELTFSIKDTEEKLALADKLEVDIKEQRTHADELKVKSKTEVDTTRQEQSRLNGVIATLRVSIAQLKTDIDQCDRDITRLKDECQGITNSLSDVQSYLEIQRVNLQKIGDSSSQRIIT